MTRSFILAAAWLSLATAACAGSPGSSLLAPTTPASNTAPPAKSAAAAGKPAPRFGANPCASYGANFVRVEGTTTCVKLGGALRVETGTSVGR
ncbi:porin [Bradyrhizobium sp. HKCCYLS3077]|uniref:porin n=1 Tax=Bradyrhizobium sp. HKCCYLS3077 TaxID=3420761 RepID=UPI003EB7EC74